MSDATPAAEAGIDRVVERARREDVRLTRVLWCGNDGTVRAKAVATDRLVPRMAGGIGMTRAQQAQDSLDRIAPLEGMGPVGELRLVPDPATFRRLPYLPRTGAMLGDVVEHSGAPSPVCPRGFLRRMEARLADHRLAATAGLENEFTLLRPAEGGGWEPIDRSPCFSTTGATASAEYVDALLDALEVQRIAVEGGHAEGGWGQNEIALAPGPALRVADEQILVREAIRAVAGRFGMIASLAPRPLTTGAGNGVHVHLSLVDRAGRNALVDRDAPDGLSPLAGHAIAGLLAHLPGLCALTAPSANSYRRLVPTAWAGAWRCWGHDNREAAVRSCSPIAGEQERSTNIEYKPSDASASPYMTLGALIAAALDGIERELAPPAPVGVDPATLSDAERAAAGIEATPATAGAALDALEADATLMEALGEPLARSFLAVRRAEWTYYEKAGEEVELADHLQRY